MYVCPTFCGPAGCNLLPVHVKYSEVRLIRVQNVTSCLSFYHQLFRDGANDRTQAGHKNDRLKPSMADRNTSVTVLEG
jgi:hypothetical protein